MNDPNRQVRSFTIPSSWTPAQADAVFELLSRLADALFCAYERPLVELAQREALGLQPDDEGATRTPDAADDDPIPF